MKGSCVASPCKSAIWSNSCLGIALNSISSAASGGANSINKYLQVALDHLSTPESVQVADADTELARGRQRAGAASRGEHATHHYGAVNIPTFARSCGTQRHARIQQPRAYKSPSRSFPSTLAGSPIAAKQRYFATQKADANYKRDDCKLNGVELNRIVVKHFFSFTIGSILYDLFQNLDPFF